MSLSITPANVVPGANADYYKGLAGDTITAGMAVYLDPVDNRLKPTDANSSQVEATVKGIALHAASAGQPLKLQTGGDLTIGASLTKGKIYILDAAGSGAIIIADGTNPASGWYCSLVGVAISTTVLRLVLFNSGAKV